uniref:BOS complex subunit TMEM147 n=1 Tax=Salix viminalis TaxID=40686 RepID=A0A6N2NDP5_SALVM
MDPLFDPSTLRSIIGPMAQCNLAHHKLGPLIGPSTSRNVRGPMAHMKSKKNYKRQHPYNMLNFRRSEYDTLGTSIKAALVYLGTALVKLVCLATFLKVSENDSFDPYQELLKALIGFIDVAGLYFALTQLTHRNISQNHKYQAVGLGWAFADSVLHRLAPLWGGARGLEFTWDFILQGLEANANLVFSISLAALGSLMWLRKNKPKTLIPIIYACAGIVATMPSITSYLRKGLGWHFPKVVGFELFTSLVMAFISWQLFSACQRPSS